MATLNINYGTDVQMTVTNLNSLANSQTAGWQSARVDNTSTKAIDYQIQVQIDLANTAAANDKAIYIYAVPWFYDGSSWFCGSDSGVATEVTGSEGTHTIATTNNLRLARVLNYNTTDQDVMGFFNLLSVFPTHSSFFLPVSWL